MKEEFIKKANLKHGNKYDYSLVDYKNSKTKIEIICSIHGSFKQTPGHHIKGQGCSKCGITKNKDSQKSSKQEFIVKSIKKHGNKYDYSLVDYVNSKTKVKIICSIHGIWEQKPNHHLEGKGCRKCSGYNKLTTEQFILKSNQVHNNKYDYSCVTYKDHYTKVDIICPIHGSFQQGAGSHMSGVGCPNCNESKGEKEIFNFLIKNKIVFERQKTFEGCVHKYRLRFDFYLPEYNTCIEYDGEQHFLPVDKWGGEENLKLIKLRDNIKTNFCKKNNINLIRITSYKDFNKLVSFFPMLDHIESREKK